MFSTGWNGWTETDGNRGKKEEELDADAKKLRGALQGGASRVFSDEREG